MAYRDPELSRLAVEVRNLQVQNLALEEQNEHLRGLIKQDLDDHPFFFYDEDDEPTNKPSLLESYGSFWDIVRCKWLGRHRFNFTVDEAPLIRAIKAKASLRIAVGGFASFHFFGRHEFFKFCQIECSRCGFVEKEAHKTWEVGSMKNLVQLTNQYHKFYETFRLAHPELGLQHDPPLGFCESNRR